MTEKRFTIDDESDIIEFDWNTNEYVDDFMWGDGKSWDRVCNRLNELYEEKEQLKLDNNRLINETAKIIAEHQGKVLDLIDNKIDELEKQYKFGQEVYHGCPMHNIRYGINTLKELKKELQE